MKSLAKTQERFLDPCCAVESDKVSYPTFYVNGEQMKEIDKWEIGEEYTIVVKVKLVGYSLEEREDKSVSSASVQITSYDTKIPKSLT